MVVKNDCVHCEDVGVQDAPGEGEVQAIAQELAELPKARISPHVQATQEKTEPLSAAATAVTEVKARSSKPHLCGSLAEARRKLRASRARPKRIPSNGGCLGYFHQEGSSQSGAQTAKSKAY